MRRGLSYRTRFQPSSAYFFRVKATSNLGSSAYSPYVLGYAK